MYNPTFHHKCTIPLPLISSSPIPRAVIAPPWRCLRPWHSRRIGDEAGGGCYVGIKVVSGWLRREKTNHDFHRGSFSGRTGRASHCLGPPCCFSLPKPFVERERAAHIPLERGGPGANGFRPLRLMGVLVIGPTSLKRGEGLINGRMCVFGRWLVVAG